MKHTDEMTERAAKVLMAETDCPPDEAGPLAFEVLKAALAGVPDAYDLKLAFEQQEQVAHEHLQSNLHTEGLWRSAEAKLAKIRDAHARYQRNDISREEFEGVIAEIAEAP